MTYRWVDHTAEVELHVEAAGLEEVFADALAAFAELVGDSAEGAPARHEVEVTAQDLPTLLADWLGELVFLAETEGLVPERASTLELAGTTLRATVEGRHGEPSPIVKAVTYHELELREDDGVWKARVVLDV